MTRIGNSRWTPGDFRALICRARSAFTMIELIASICILAAIVGFVALPAIVDAFKSAQMVADKQTLTVLNEALISFKCQGGDLNALTAGAPISHVLTALKTEVNWSGMKHQFLGSGQTYPASKLQAIGMKQTYQFTKFGTYGADADTMTDILGRLSAQGTPADATMQTWITSSLATAGTKTFWVFSNPTDRIGFYLAGTGKLEINWGDGSAPVDATLGGGTAYTHTYGSAATRPVVLIGNITYIQSNETAPLGGTGSSSFSGDISTMTGLTHLEISVGNTVYGDVSKLTKLNYLYVVGNNTISGSIANLTDLTQLGVQGYNTISGSVTNLTKLTQLNVSGSNTISGSIDNIPGLTLIAVNGNNTVTGSLSGRTTLQLLSEGGNSSFTHPSDWSPFTGLCSVFVKNLTTSAAVDNFLVSMDNNKGQTKLRSERTIFCSTNCAVPGTAGLAAKASLISAGWSVHTN